ncbi:hypothetical protein JCM10908_003230 [Rhodotorula pacifica]|uniref:double-stranded DNA-dependent ATPase n=1 Tax=Rhodotorula pacifica TaxID=1495444 RepID=UPI0031702541
MLRHARLYTTHSHSVQTRALTPVRRFVAATACSSTPLCQGIHSTRRLDGWTEVSSIAPASPSLSRIGHRTFTTTARASSSSDAPLARSAIATAPLPSPEPTRIKANLFTLRPYQQQCVDAVLSELARDEFTRLGVSAPTGSGKTAMFTSLIAQLPPRRHETTGQEARQVLVVVNSIQLATQTAEAIQRAYPDMTVDVEQGKSSATGLADVTVATFQTLAYNDFSRLEKFLPESHKAIIIDEAHHAAAPSYIEILSRFDPLVETALIAEGLDGVEAPVLNEVIEERPMDREEEVEEQEQEEEDNPDAVDDFLPSADSLDASSAAGSAPSASSTDQSTQYIDEPTPLPMLLDPASGRARVPLLAFTATWGRADGLALGKVFEKIVWHADWLDMVRGKWLSDIQFTTVQIGPETLNLDKVKTSAVTGDYNLSALAREVNTTAFANVAVDAWFEKAQDRRSTLVFGASVAHVVTLTNTFRARGIDARFVYEGTKQADRVEIYRAFRAGEFPVLVNCGILTEGADFAEIDCVLLARPTRSQNLFLQMLGRGLRLSPASGKKDCLVIDLVAFSERPNGMVCTPTLFGLDPLREIEGQTVDELQAARQDETLTAAEQELEQDDNPPTLDPTLRPYSLSYKHYATVFDLVDSGAGEVEPVSRLSRNAWVGCGNDVWVLELMGKGYIRVARHAEAKDNYQAQLYARLPAFITGPGVVRYRSPQEIALHPDLPILLRTVDAYIKQHADFADLALGRYAPWRMGPASDAQRKFILKKVLTPDERAEGKTSIDGVWIGRPWRSHVDVMDPDAFTKGQACDILARVMYGGLGHWKKKKKELVKQDKLEAKNGQHAIKAREKKEQAEAKKVERAAERERKRVEKMLQKMQARKQARGGKVASSEAT